MHSGLLSLCKVNDKKSGIIFMRIKITDNIRNAVEAFLMDNLNYTPAQIANEIGCDQSILCRVLNGQTRTMSPYTYNRLEYNFIKNYLPKADLIQFDPSETIKPLVFRNPELDKYKKENKDLKAELKKYKSALKKLSNIIGAL